MNDIPISLAVAEYEHFRDLFTGDVRVPGATLTPLNVPVEELLFRTLRFREWDVSEAGIGAYSAQVSQGKSEVVGLPVFTSRLFRHSAIYVRTDSGIRRPADLAGKRIGMPEWAMAAAVYARGLLTDAHGVDLRSVRWVQAGLYEAGRRDKTQSRIPPGVEYTPVPEKSLVQMLAARELDGVISARQPRLAADSGVQIEPLFADLRAEEEKYWDASGVLPIMHLLVMRRETYEKNRWLAAEITKACEEAKNRSLERAMDVTASFLPIPWLGHHMATVRARMGDDFWPYGVEKNRKTLEAFLRYCDEHGVTQRKLAVEELFAPELLAVSRT